MNPFKDLSKIQVPVFAELTTSKFIKFTIALVCLSVVLGLISLFLRSEPSPEPESPKIQQGLQPEQAMKPGGIGEIEETAGVSAPKIDEPFGPSGFPSVIFNTAGEILEVGKDKITILGDGQNFADQQSRELTIVFTASTVVFEPGQKIKHQGIDGLKYLKSGMEISIESEENVRGKTEFIARSINIF